MLIDRPLGFPSADDAFGPTLKAARERAGMTQDDLATEMRQRTFEFHQATIYKIENGKRKVTIGEAIALAELVGVPLEVLAARDPDSVRARQFMMNTLAEEVVQGLSAVSDMVNEATKQHAALGALVREYDKVVGDDVQEIDGVKWTAAERYAPLLNFEGHIYFRDAYNQFTGSFEGHEFLYPFGTVDPWEDDE